MSIGENIKKYRGTMKQEEFAEKLGVNTVTVSRWENDANTPNSKMLNKIAEVLNVSPTKLLEGTATPQTKELNERHLKEDYGMMSYTFSDNEVLRLPATPELIPIFEKIIIEKLKLNQLNKENV